MHSGKQLNSTELEIALESNRVELSFQLYIGLYYIFIYYFCYFYLFLFLIPRASKVQNKCDTASRADIRKFIPLWK